MTIRVSSKFDAGNVEVRLASPCRAQLEEMHESHMPAQVVNAKDPQDVQLKIRPDPYCKGDDITHFQ